MFQRSFRFFAAALLLCFIGGVARSQSAPIVYADSIAAVAGVEFSGVVASLKDYADYADVFSVVSIDWGDGQTSSGTLSEYSFPVYDAFGTHTYAEPGTYVTKITVMDADGLSGSSSGSAVVTSAVVVDPPLTATGLNIQSGKSFSGVVATFTDADPYAAASDFTATIQWGDGTSSAGAIYARAGGGFNVSGSHTYRKPGSYAATVTIKDVGGSTAIARTTINVKK